MSSIIVGMQKLVLYSAMKKLIIGLKNAPISNWLKFVTYSRDWSHIHGTGLRISPS